MQILKEKISGYGCQSIHEIELEHAICKAINSINGNSVVVRGTLTYAQDLVSYCRAMECVNLGPDLETQAAPVQLSPGPLNGVVLKLSIGSLDIYQAVCNRDVVFPDRGNFFGIGIAEEDCGLSAMIHRAGLFSPRRAGKRSVRLALNPRNILAAGEEAEPGLLNPPSSARFFGACEALLGAATAQSKAIHPDGEFIASGADIRCLLDGFRAALDRQSSNSSVTHGEITARLFDLADCSSGLRVDDIAARMHMPRRTLHHRVSRDLGHGPKKLMKNLKMRDVTLKIPAAIKAGMGIGDLAFEHGFSDFARFCSDYRILFGERPGDTVRRYRELR